MANPKFNFEAVLKKGMDQAGMFDPKERAQFLGQLAHESLAGALMYEVWGPTKQQLKYERDFKAPWGPGLKPGDTNYVAFNLGNTEVGDGYKYRGRSFIQVTGRANYTACGKYLGLDLINNPDLLVDPDTAVKAALWYWRVQRPRIPGMAQAGDTLGVTKAINGGTNGLDDRIARVNAYMKRDDLVKVDMEELVANLDNIPTK